MAQVVLVGLYRAAAVARLRCSHVLVLILLLSGQG